MPTASSGAAGVPINIKRPGAQVQVLFGASPNGAGGGARKILILANKTSAGSATVDTEIFPINIDDDAATKAGDGSEMHLMAKAIRKRQPLATLLGLCPTEATGASAAATLTVANNATGSGTLKLSIHGVPIYVFVANGDTPTVQAANIDKAIKSATRDLCVTSSPSAGVVTITYKHVGTRGNSVRLRVEAESSITASTYTLSAAALASGSGDDSLTAALATAATSRYHYYCHAHVATAQLAAIKLQLNTMAGPLVGRRQQAICAVSASLGTATTLVQAVNAERMQMLWCVNSSTLPCVAAAAWVGNRASGETDSLITNFSSFNPTAVDLSDTVAAPYSEADWLTDSQANAGLDVGLTPLQVDGTSKGVYVPLSITTHSQDSAGNPDTRTLTTNYVTVPDAFADEFVTWVPSAFPNRVLVPDIKGGDDPLPGNATTPGFIKSQWKQRCETVFSNEVVTHLYDLEADYRTWAFNLVQGNPNRCAATMACTPAPWFTQITAQVRQQTPGF